MKILVPAALIVLLAALAFTATIPSATAGILQWNTTTGNWEDAANWTLQSGVDDGGNGFPDNSDEARPIGGADINVVNPLSVNNIYWLIGDGGADLSGAKITLTGDLVRKDRDGAFNISTPLEMTNRTDFLANGSSGSLNLLGDITGTGNFAWRGGQRVEIFGNNSFTGRVLGRDGTAVLHSPTALGASTGNYEVLNNSSNTLLLASDAAYNGQLRINGGGVLKLAIANSGSTDRTMTFKAGTTTSHTGEIEFVANDPGNTGDLTLQFLQDSAGTQQVANPISTLVDSIVELAADDPSAQIELTAGAAVGQLSGTGKLRKTGAGLGLIEVEQMHTGGTDIDAGTLRLSDALASHTGQLPDTGLVTVASSAVFDLDGVDDTVGGLGGGGTVQLDNAMLSLAEGLDLATELTIEGSGQVALQPGTTNTFTLGPLAGESGALIFTTSADLAVDGTLLLQGDNVEQGLYTLIDTNLGTISGDFDSIVTDFPRLIEAHILRSANQLQVQILAVPEPAGVLWCAWGVPVALAVHRRLRRRRRAT